MATAKNSDQVVIELFLDMLAAERGAAKNTLAAYARDLGDFSTPSEDRIGTGFGDQLFGVPRGYYEDRNRAYAAANRSSPDWIGKIGGAIGNFVAHQPVEETKRASLLDYLSQAGGIVDQLGIGQGSGVDYSGAMSQAQANRDRNSAYLTAVYNQLRTGLGDLP